MAERAGDGVNLTIRLFGLELLHIEASTEDVEADGAELAGGTLGCERIEAGETDRYMGFTNGRECE